MADEASSGDDEKDNKDAKSSVVVEVVLDESER